MSAACRPQDHLIAAGRALFGERWQTDVARALGVDSRRVRQWMAGERPIPAGVWPDLAGLVRQRQMTLKALLDSSEPGHTDFGSGGGGLPRTGDGVRGPV